MQTCIALFRGINVGGNNTLSMKDLVALLESLGLDRVRTCLQSGNAVFRTAEDDRRHLASAIRSAIGKQYSFEPAVLLLTVAEMEQAVAAIPFLDAVNEPATLHLGFLDAVPEHPDREGLEKLRNGSERYELKGNVFYLHAPDGTGRSKLAAGAERLLGVPMTGRNWRTVGKILVLAKKEP
ncbi:DUF1697 domain-containing protein [Geobacter sp. SVR]|uniref:DUF1697 domain-containing protein n=1 Tax=Geobacter sp. SVR TaxID=2495594 RepID=UPI00143EFEE4|nr:DUF1697 domain-containing protein [Geobacter sp. SVR]BCS51705.1 hypothetical protein GSVR_00130 [Geobacter sp. SVR]GCF84892.1 hypothetical protein GSbR_14920 [Geobacter sp. SVR]